MAKPPIQVDLNESDYNLMINALSFIMGCYSGGIQQEAEHLKHKIETYGRYHDDNKDASHGDYARLCFFLEEGRSFVYMFLACATLLSNAYEVNVDANCFSEFKAKKLKEIEEYQRSKGLIE